MKPSVLLILSSIYCKIIVAHWTNNNAYSIETIIEQNTVTSRGMLNRYDEKALNYNKTYKTLLANRTISSYSSYPFHKVQIIYSILNMPFSFLCRIFQETRPIYVLKRLLSHIGGIFIKMCHYFGIDCPQWLVLLARNKSCATDTIWEIIKDDISWQVSMDTWIVGKDTSCKNITSEADIRKFIEKYLDIRELKNKMAVCVRVFNAEHWVTDVRMQRDDFRVYKIVLDVPCNSKADIDYIFDSYSKNIQKIAS